MSTAYRAKPFSESAAALTGMAMQYEVFNEDFLNHWLRGLLASASVGWFLYYGSGCNGARG